MVLIAILLVLVALAVSVVALGILLATEPVVTVLTIVGFVGWLRYLWWAAGRQAQRAADRRAQTIADDPVLRAQMQAEERHMIADARAELARRDRAARDRPHDRPDETDR